MFSVRSKHILDKPCHICGETKNVEMHHVRHIIKVKIKGFSFTKLMAKMNIKQIPVCKSYHIIIHSGRYDGPKLEKSYTISLSEEKLYA